MSAWRLPRGSTAAERIGGALGDAHANKIAVLTGEVALSERGRGGCVGVGVRGRVVVVVRW
jgi:hypothetical protein